MIISLFIAIISSCRRQKSSDTGLAKKFPMARNYFGTDGIRGTANLDPMTAEVALRLVWQRASFYPWCTSAFSGHRKGYAPLWLYA